MNQASSRPIFLRNDDMERARRSFAFFFLLCCFGLCVVAGGSFYCGMLWKEAQHQEAKRIEAAKPKRAQPATFTPLLSCSKHDLIEYARTCRARERMSSVVAP